MCEDGHALCGLRPGRRSRQSSTATILEKVNAVAEETGAVIEVSSDPECLERRRRDLYTDIWASMGEEAEIPERVKLLTPYKVTMEMLEQTGEP